MGSRILSLGLVVAVFGAFLLTGAAAESQQVITTFSGRHVPIDLVQEHFVRKLSTSDHNANIIYELTDQYVIRGPGLHLDLQEDVLPVRDILSPVTPVVTLNGAPGVLSSKTVKTLRVKSYSVIVDRESQEILAVTGKDLILAPLHRKKHPGVFVNKRAFIGLHYDLTGDIQVDAEQDLGNSPRDFRSSLDEEVQVGGEVLADSVTVSTRQTGSCASGTTHYLEIAVAYDNTFCALYNNVSSVATTALQDVIDEANRAYAINTCIQLAVVNIEAHCNDQNDPYEGFSSRSPGEILSGFGDIWRTSRTTIQRDSAYLVTGFMDGTSVAGIAYIGAACSTRVGYGWIEGANAIILAHEIGHTLGGRHTSSGIMGAVATPQTQFQFSSDSIQQFSTFVDNTGNVCMGTTQPPGTPGGTSPPATSSTPATQSTTTQTPTTQPPTTQAPPTVPPVGSGETCASGFTRSRALNCRSRRLQRLTFSSSGTRVGVFRVILQQRNGQYIVRYRASGRLFISQFRDVVSLTGDSDFGAFETPTGNGKRAQSETDANELERPAGATTCCGQDLFVATEVTICINDNGSNACQPIAETYTTRVACRNICRGNPSGTFTPMSASLACPTCA